MSIDKINIRHVLLYEFSRGSTAMKTVKNICEVYGEDAVTGGVTQSGNGLIFNWIVHFSVFPSKIRLLRRWENVFRLRTESF
ncbi:hypothetical protein WH47_00615 [Habropoda laboriosa]|uniref:Mos1 transposase HTH domain-containing protein n=1 Tax=Habropoda laboriosa TaxID=597456 RepID=A0A0L7RHY4_9HYME|nr:hypothetical protein WH47_00615 [Habropoda laboriosa]